MAASNYLLQYIKALTMVELAEQKTIIVDKSSCFRYVSGYIRRQNNLIEANLDGAGYADIPAIRQIAGSCIAEDLECIATLRVQKYITSQNYNGEIQLYLKEKYPIIDPELQQAVGVRVDFLAIYSLGHFKPYINRHIAKFDSSAFDIEQRNKVKLTELEELILFLLIMYVKPKVVTRHLNTILQKDVAVSTLRNTIHQQLMRKFAVLSVEELIDKAIFLGYDTILPSIMAEQFSIRLL